MEEQTGSSESSRNEKKALEKARIVQQERMRKTLKLITAILKKDVSERTENDLEVLLQHQDIVQRLSKRKLQRTLLKRKQEEVFDDAEDLRIKVKQLAEAIRTSHNLIIYTGAGISTAASIPDYRGPNGVWTKLKKGQSVSVGDLSQAEPTFTHMCIKMLHEEKLVRHVVSQNCDGLHLRSGLPRLDLSELHGNMFIEVCTTCIPVREYIRLFDVTERTAVHRHFTGRQCGQCGGDLRDTIVHFGERGILDQPLNWKGAIEAAERCDAIVCLGSSLKVLKKYPRLWCMSRPAIKRPRLYIVNLQEIAFTVALYGPNSCSMILIAHSIVSKWTPKDEFATLKIHGNCDDVMSLLMEELNMKAPTYNRVEDPIFKMATILKPWEETSHTRKLIMPPAAVEAVSLEFSDHAGQTPTQGGWFGRGCNKGQKKNRSRNTARNKNSKEKPFQG